MPNPDQLLFSRRDAAALLGISERGLMNLEREGVFKPIRLGISVRYTKASLQSAIDQIVAKS